MRLVSLLVSATVAATTLTPTVTRAVPAPTVARFAADALPPKPTSVVVPEGTEFSVETIETISSKTAAEGDRVSLRADEAVMIGGQAAIAKGTAVKGIVAAVEKAGRMGKGGKLNLRIESTTAVDGQRIALRATKAKEGDDKTGSTVALTVIFGPIGLLKKGKDATYPEGTRVTVYTDAAVTVTLPAAAQ